jgi:hypothetical protein
MKDKVLIFDGETYDPVFDKERLKIQLGRVFLTIMDRQWWTLRELSKVTGAPEASVSARLRDLRKERFGSHLIERRAREERARGWFEYRLGESK